MQAADYRLVRSQITTGIMRGIKQSVRPQVVDIYFSYWLYGERKSIEQIPVNLSQSISCHICSQENDDFSLLNIDLNLFLRCLPLFNNEQLSIIYSLLDDDQQIYRNAIRQHDEFGTDYCPYMSLMSSSKDSIIYANIETSKFYVTVQSEDSGSKCEIPFNEPFVCGVSIGKYQDSTKQWFIYWGFDETLGVYYVRTVYYNQSNSHKCLYNYTDTQNLHTDSVVFQVAHDGLMAYGFDYNSAHFYDLQLNKVKSINKNFSFTPSDMSLTRTGDQVITIGYLKNGTLSSSLMYATVCLSKLNSTNYSITILNCVEVHHFGYHFSEYHPGPKLSVDINNDTNLFVIGNSANKSIEIFKFDNKSIMSIHKYESHVETNSVCWLQDGHRIAVVAHLTSTSSWSQSQIQIYDTNLMIHNWPDYIFPNNQQQLDSWNYKNPVFILISAWSQWNSLIILMNTQKILIILSAESGSYADPLSYSWFDNPWIWIGLKNRRHKEQSSTPCWPGMYKDEESILPCQICPTQTKSEINSTKCSSCDHSLFCPLASVEDTNINSMIDIHEPTTYPRSSDSTQFEDILLANMFLIGNSTRCILISPLFWTLIVLIIVIFILLIIGVLKFFPQSHKHRIMIKQIFRQTDFIGQGEFWIGGLMSFSLLVLLVFAFLFSNEYVNLYPIEEPTNSKMICDEKLRNSHFETNLKLLTATRSDQDQIIFDMLNNQPFTLVVNFINTNFDCEQLEILEGTGHNLHEPVSEMTCMKLNSSQIIHTSIPSYHEVTFQYTIKHFAPIGGLYICLMGPGNISDDGMNTLRETKFCKWIAQENQTIGYTPEVNLLNTKIINRTANLIQGKPTKSSGVWQTTFIGSELSDQLLYNRRGEYHRYLSVETVFTISLNENHFYVENNQEPIARKAEANFHTVLFMSLALEMFCLTFLMFKLIFVPLFRYIERKILLHSRIKPFNEQAISDVQS
ncbi:unnamed protein product [Adineta steineri]|uniref:Uncharacterized protein n=1 Tax=Adineta steineri TaxID=433720 RepID=A0A819D015_9BILA|nr:unnamed protein product [Adineta steineri]